MLRYWTILFIVMGIIDNGRCDIKCYSCSSKEDPRCINPVGVMDMKKCNEDALRELQSNAEKISSKNSELFEVNLQHYDNNLVPLRCFKQVTVVRAKEYILRGCQIDSGTPEICTVVTTKSSKLNIGNVSHCSLCHTDGCNHAAAIGSSGLLATLIMMLAQKII